MDTTKTLTRDQMQAILDTRPKNVAVSQAIDMFVKNGYKIEGVNWDKQEQTLGSKLMERGKTIISEVTAKPMKETLAGADTSSGKDIALSAVEGGLRTAQAPIRVAGAIGGAAGDIIGSALEATGADKVIAGAVAPIVNSSPGQKAISIFQSLPKEQQEVLSSIIDSTNLVGVQGGSAIGKQGVKMSAQGVTQVAKIPKSFGESVYKSGFTPSTAEAEKILAYEASKPDMFSSLYGAGAIKGNPSFKPITVSDTALRRGIAGTEKQLGVQAKQVADALYREEISPAVKGIKGDITKDELFSPLIERIAGITDPTKKKAYENAFEALSEDYATIAKFSYEQAQKLKSELDEFTPAKVFKGQDVANEFRMLQNDMANTIRQKTYEALSDINIRQKYIDYGNLQELKKVGVKAISDGGTKGGFGSFWTSVYDKLLTPVKTVGGKTLYNIGGKLEVIAPKGLENQPFSEYLKLTGFIPQQAEETIISSQQ